MACYDCTWSTRLATWVSPRPSRLSPAASFGKMLLRRLATTFDTVLAVNCRPLTLTGLLQSFEVPPYAWHTVTTDYITGHPLTADGNNAIVMSVDKLTKYVHAVPCKTTSDVVDWANMYMQHGVQHEGLPPVIISNRAPHSNKQSVARLGIQ